MYDFLLDTNILVYASNPFSRFRIRARALLKGVLDRQLDGCLSIQNLYEFYAIITDPKRVESPLTISEAQKLLANYIEAENLPKIFPQETNGFNMLELLRKYKISKQEIFDAYLVATMTDNKVSVIYTADERLFKKFEFLKVINPFK